MTARKVKVELTYAEAMALFALADCAFGIAEHDAMGVLGNMSRVRAGARGIEKLFAAANGGPREYAHIEIPEKQ